MIVKKTFYEWTKKLGQQHWEHPYPDKSGTLCGKPMLGNNYARIIKKENKIPCENCVKVILELSQTERKQFFKELKTTS